MSKTDSITSGLTSLIQEAERRSLVWRDVEERRAAYRRKARRASILIVVLWLVCGVAWALSRQALWAVPIILAAIHQVYVSVIIDRLQKEFDDAEIAFLQTVTETMVYLRRATTNTDQENLNVH